LNAAPVHTYMHNGYRILAILYKYLYCYHTALNA
jgi:hypothetical protein